MNMAFLRQLPYDRVGQLYTHPEPYHLRVLFMVACRCGPAPVFVEHGVTHGQVTHVLLEAMRRLPGSELHLLGQVPAGVKAMTEEAEFAGRIYFQAPKRKPSLWFVGRPEYALLATEQAQAAGCRVIIAYDTRAAERFGLNRFIPSAQAARRLMNDVDREWYSLCQSISGQQTRRGMLVAELKHWSGEAQEEKTLVPEDLPEPVAIVEVKPSSRFDPFAKKNALPPV